jgi:hypothetical protein
MVGNANLILADWCGERWGAGNEARWSVASIGFRDVKI